ncbi:MAG: PHP domain-containing protein [Clostridiales bacterium]|nr:PHP domain-containing protein [Clostridiales bacterium]
MKIFADLHTHTDFSHGKGTIEDNVKAAIARDLKQVAITDHGISHWAYGLRRREVDEYLGEVDRLKEKYGDKIQILAGVEANILGEDGAIDVPDWLDKRLDVVLMGFHRAARNRQLKNWMRFIILNGQVPFKGWKEKEIERNTRAFTKAVRNHRIDVITHPMYIARMHMGEVAAVCKEMGTLIEINNKHNEISKEELMEAMAAGADFILSSDAHHPDNVGVVDTAAKRAEDAGIGQERIFNTPGYAGSKRIGQRG